MLDINLIRDDPDRIRDAMRLRNEEPAIVDLILKLDVERRKLLTESEKQKAKRNAVSKEISQMKDAAARQSKIDAMRAVGDAITGLDEQLRQVDEQLHKNLSSLPNIPDPSVPIGAGEQDNQVVKTVGKKSEYNFTPKPHWELGPELGLINFDQGTKLSGTRFYVLSGAGARLQRAIISWMLDLHIRQGYTEKYLPFMLRSDILYAAGQLPKFIDNLYHDAEEDFWFVPTAEVPLTGLHSDEILEEASLPIKYTAYTPCWRREKMSAGKDVREIKRGHQFDKVEMYKYCLPDNSTAEHEALLKDAEDTAAGLGLTYRVVAQCTGDLSFASQRTFDIEVWAPGCGEWLEVSSVSNVGDFQARRANIRYRPADGSKPRFVHTLNGSGLALPRIMIAIIENYQEQDGSVKVPDVLKPWMGGIEVIRREP
ncbi:MAG: serine--tRNA ligase [Anaerolineaceae bacterium]|nr:serine--tRNA ligase [Anaerolineaceae bacterium]